MWNPSRVRNVESATARVNARGSVPSCADDAKCRAWHPPCPLKLSTRGERARQTRRARPHETAQRRNGGKRWLTEETTTCSTIDCRRGATRRNMRRAAAAAARARARAAARAAAVTPRTRASAATAATRTTRTSAWLGDEARLADDRQHARRGLVEPQRLRSQLVEHRRQSRPQCPVARRVERDEGIALQSLGRILERLARLQSQLAQFVRLERPVARQSVEQPRLAQQRRRAAEVIRSL